MLSEKSITDYPKQLDSNIRFRVEILKAAETDPLLQANLKELCKRDIIFWINLFSWTKDPRKIPDVLPFICYEAFQEDYIRRIESAINNQHDLLTEKSRDMGVSWMVLFVFHHKWLFEDGSDFRVGSRKEEFVDRPNDIDTLFEKIRFNQRRQPAWLQPKGFDWGKHSTYMKLINPENGNAIVGESANEDFGSGGRRKAILMDEYSKWEKNVADAAWTATADVSKCRLPVSTPKGSGNKFSKLANGTKEKIEKITLHWTLHPEKSAGAYFYRDGLLNTVPLGKGVYQLWKQGYKVRSPWYDAEDARRSKADLAQEVDIDYHASGYPFFDLAALQTQIVYEPFVRKTPVDVIPVNKYITVNLVDIDNKIEVRERPGGWLRVFELPKEDSQYVVGADTSEGLVKGDEAFGVVRDKYTRNVVACANGAYDPDTWAVKLHLIGKYYKQADVAPENNNHGYSVCSDLKENDCKLFWTEKKAENGSVSQVKAGWTTDARTRPEMLDQMEEEIRKGALELRDYVLIEQCRTFVRNEKSGKPEADGDLLDDGVIACAIAGGVIKLKPYKKRNDTNIHKLRKRAVWEIDKQQNGGFGFGA